MTSNLTGLDNLPAKDASLFKSTLKYYEHKQYKKGLKVCEQLIKKHPQHGESMAMKGLFLSYLNKKEEAYEYVRQGLKYSLKSHVCWHVYGLLYRADKNYDEAMKCYRNALRFDKDNNQILRDLAVLQLQMRHYSGLCETRFQLLSQRPAAKLNWINLAIAYYLDGRLDQSLGILDAMFEGFPVEDSTHTLQLEQSELYYFKTMVLEEAGRYEDALKFLENMKKLMCIDPCRWLEKKATILKSLGKTSEAKIIYEHLFHFNPDSKDALIGILNCLDDSLNNKLDVLGELLKKYPSSLTLKIELINGSQGLESLESYLREFILPMSRKGILSSFNIIKKLYRNKVNDQVLDNFIDFLSGELESYPWLNILMAQHYSFRNDTPKAISHMEKVLEKHHNVPEVYMYYAKILKRCGFLEKAADCMKVAKLKDPSDRFLNSKATKYFLRARRIEEAKEFAVQFVKKGEFENQLQDLVEMQSLWFAYEMGLAYQSSGDHQMAIKYFDQMYKHFDDFYDDQFDFHNYILRRMTLCSYVKMLCYEDCIAGHPVFLKTAKAAVRSILVLKDRSIVNGLATPSPSGNEQQSKLESSKWVDRATSMRNRDPEAYLLAASVYKAEERPLKFCKAVILALKNGGVLPADLLEYCDDLMKSSDLPEMVAFQELFKKLFPVAATSSGDSWKAGDSNETGLSLSNLKMTILEGYMKNLGM